MRFQQFFLLSEGERENNMMYPCHACVLSIASLVPMFLKEIKQTEEVREGMYNLQTIKQPTDPPVFAFSPEI